MIEVLPCGVTQRWFYQFLSAEGRPLVISKPEFASDNEANDAAKNYRSNFFATTALIDHKQYHR